MSEMCAHCHALGSRLVELEREVKREAAVAKRLADALRLVLDMDDRQTLMFAAVAAAYDDYKESCARSDRGM
jgi:hypothetical protein